MLLTYDSKSNVITEPRPDGGVTRKEYDTLSDRGQSRVSPAFYRFLF